MTPERGGTRVRASVRLTLGGTFASAVVQFATMVTLARLLTPADYGYYIVALSINAVSTAFMASAFERALIIEPDDAQAMNGRTIPVLGVLISVSLLALMITKAISVVTGWAVDSKVLATVLAAQIIAAIALVPRAKLRRTYRYAPIVCGEVGGLILGNFTFAYFLAQQGYGPFALAFGMMVGNTVGAIAILSFDRTGMESIRIEETGHVRSTALGLIKVTGAEAVNGQITPLIVSALLGPVTLGLFNRIYTLTALPIQLMVASVNRVLLAFFIDASEDLEKSRLICRRIVRMIGLLTIPCSLGVGGAANEFVLTVLGESWIEGVASVPFITLAMAGVMIATVLGQLAEARKYFNEKVRVQFISTIILVIAAVVGSMGELLGVSIAVLLAAVIFLILSIRLASKIVDVPELEIANWLLPSLIVGCVCFVLNVILSSTLEAQSVYLVFALQIGGSGIVALFGALILLRDVLDDIVRMALPAKLAERVRRLLRCSAT